MTNDRTTANPPLLGMGILLIRRALGWSTAPILKANQRTIGVKQSDIQKVPIRIKMYSREKEVIGQPQYL